MFSIQVVATGRCKHTHHLHSLAGSRHLGWLYILVIGTNAAETWECIYAFEVLSLVPLHIPRNGIDVFQLLNRVSQFGIPWTAACKFFLFFTIALSLLKVMSIQSVMPSQPSHHLLPLFPPTSNLSQHIRGFASESVLCIMWPMYWSFSFSISPFNEYSGLISFRIDLRFDLFAIKGTLKSLLQCHSLKASILWCSDLFMVQLWQPYIIIGKTRALTIQTFVSKVVSLPFTTCLDLS